MSLFIKNNEFGLLYKRGNYVKLLHPGNHFIAPFSHYNVEIYNILDSFNPSLDLEMYAADHKLMEELHVIDVPDTAIVLHYIDNHFSEVLTSGKYAFWRKIKKHTFKECNTSDIYISNDINSELLQHDALSPFIERYYINSYERGLLFIDGIFDKILEPGNYNFWSNVKTIQLSIVDMRQQQLDMTGQEIMTQDKVTLRLNFICQYKIIDPVKPIIDIKDYKDQLYILLQLILREYIGTLKLDELLQQKESIGIYTLEKLREKAHEFGIEFIYTGLKDVILPGEIKEILNKVIEAEKKAQANIITRREETASTRSLLNTAKLMEDNPTLYKLKELEYIEKISEKISSLSVIGGGKLLEQIKEIFKTD